MCQVTPDATTATESFVRDQVKIRGTIDEIDRGRVACGVDLSRVAEVVPAVLISIRAVVSPRAELVFPIVDLLRSGVSAATVVFVATQLLRTDIFSYVHDGLHDLITDVYQAR